MTVQTGKNEYHDGVFCQAEKNKSIQQHGRSGLITLNMVKPLTPWQKNIHRESIQGTSFHYWTRHSHTSLVPQSTRFNPYPPWVKTLHFPWLWRCAYLSGDQAGRCWLIPLLRSGSWSPRKPWPGQGTRDDSRSVLSSNVAMPYSEACCEGD